MHNQLIEDIEKEFSVYDKNLFIVKDIYGFLRRNDVKTLLFECDIRVCEKQALFLRIDYELNYKKSNQKTLYIVNTFDNILEDILNEGVLIDFGISSYLGEYHIKTILEEDLTILERLYLNKPDRKQNKRENEMILGCYRGSVEIGFDVDSFKRKIFDLIEKERVDWFLVIEEISKALLSTIGSKSEKRIIAIIEDVNKIFQMELSQNYKDTLNASSIKKPKVVSSMLDYISYHNKTEKIVLIVVDGMSYWQYLLMKELLSPKLSVVESMSYSWIPSITQLSRQAIFRGSKPLVEYRQNPKNEEKLWKAYWLEKGLSSLELRYDYNEVKFDNLESISKLAIVYSDLDEKMHSSTDYVDLKSLTLNWLKRTAIAEYIKRLSDKGFIVYLTTDHGNVQAKAWRNLKGKEKLGSNKSGSRSSRHIEYSDSFLADEFLDENEELCDCIVQDEKVLYMSGNLSFSKASDLVTHGGSHILEVVIPFIKIENE